MSQHNDDGTQQFVETSNLVQFPFKPSIKDLDIVEEAPEETPVYDALVKDAEKLDKLSAYKSEFDYTAYRGLEVRCRPESCAR